MNTTPQRTSALLVPREPSTPNWTATHDKALIGFVRAHGDQIRTTEFWRRAAVAAGRSCGASCAYKRWRDLCTMGIPYVTADYPRGRRQRLIHAAVLADLKTMSRAEVARKHGVTRRMVDYVVMIYGVNAKSLPKPCNQEAADIALAAQAWAEFEKSQHQE